MIPLGRINEAYDALNLARDASLQTVRDRYNVLKDRITTSQDTSRLVAIEEAFHIIEKHEEAKRIQREAASGQVRTRSERDLDGTLQKLTAQTSTASNTAKRVLGTEQEEGTKRVREDEQSQVKPQVDEPGKRDPGSDALVFDKLTKLLKDESKFIRAVNVLQGVIKSIIDGSRFTEESVAGVIGSIEVAISSRGLNGGIPLANVHEDNRKAMAKVLALIESSPEFLGMITTRGYYWRVWDHSVVFRNSLYDLDNFQFSKRCRELIVVTDNIDLTSMDEESKRMLLEIERTTDVLCSSYISKVVPGRLNEVKKTMTEIYKLTRTKDFPKQFKNRIAEHQINLATN